MPTERPVLTVAQAVNRAVDAVDPLGKDDRLADLFARYEDRDEPVTAAAPIIEDELAEWKMRLDPEDDDPALVVAIAIATYLVFRRGQVGDSDDELIRLAIRAELHDKPPRHVQDWLDMRP